MMCGLGGLERRQERDFASELCCFVVVVSGTATVAGVSRGS